MIYPSHDDLIYLAGLIDGEGCIRITNCPRPIGRPLFRVEIAVELTTPLVLEWAKDRWDGSITHSTNAGRKDTWAWRLSGDAATTLLHRLQPYMKIKQQQAWLAQEAWAQRQPSPNLARRTPPTPAEVMALREGYARASTHLNSGIA